MYKILDIDFKTKNVFSLRVEKPSCDIKAGQCFNVGIPGMGINREYSIYSNANEDYIEFLIRKVNNGIVSQALSTLNTKDYVEINGPYGEFILKDEFLNSKLVFIATGTGIAPFHSFVKTYPFLNYKIIHGVRYNDEQYDLSDYSPERYISCISSKNNKNSSRVTDFLKDNILPKDVIIYICGNRNMIIDVVELLLNQGISGNQILTEVFF